MGLIDCFGTLNAVFVKDASIKMKYNGKSIFMIEDVKAIDFKLGHTNENLSDALTKVIHNNHSADVKNLLF